jgi:hypothetical protein
MLLLPAAAFVDSYAQTISLFEHSGQSARFFGNSYGFAVFPTTSR